VFNLIPGSGLGALSPLGFGLGTYILIEETADGFWDYREDLIMTGIADFFRGDTKKYKVVLKDLEGNPISVAGSILTMTMKSVKADTDEDAALQVTQTGVDPAEGATGEIVITLPAIDTHNLEIKKYYYDFQVVNLLLEVTTLLSGSVKVLEDTTRSTS